MTSSSSERPTAFRLYAYTSSWRRLRSAIGSYLPNTLRNWLRPICHMEDLGTTLRFMRKVQSWDDFIVRFKILRRLYRTTFNVECPHTQTDILSFIEHLLSLPPERQGAIVEAGCYKGGSTAKFSIAAKAIGRPLFVFDSFNGLPENSERHSCDIFGRPIAFPAESYAATLISVQSVVAKYGELDVCTFVPGYFEATLPHFNKPILAAYIDVDLASSTRTCMKYFYSLLTPGGTIFSHDGHLPLVIDVLDSEEFWKNEVGATCPLILGLGKEKLLRIIKPAV